MITVMAIALSLGAAPEALVKHQSKQLALQVPGGWKRVPEDGAEKFVAPSGEAWFLLDVGAVQSATMKPSVCLEKILDAIGGGGWEKLAAGGNPAAKKIEIDEVPGEKLKLRSVTYVGCDGKTTWSIIFYVDESKRAQFEPLLGRVIQSVSYSPPPK
jgi:hypothetical protein